MREPVTTISVFVGRGLVLRSAPFRRRRLASEFDAAFSGDLDLRADLMSALGLYGRRRRLFGSGLSWRRLFRRRRGLFSGCPFPGAGSSPTSPSGSSCATALCTAPSGASSSNAAATRHARAYHHACIIPTPPYGENTTVGGGRTDD